MRHRMPAPIGIALIALVLTGCSGGDKKDAAYCAAAKILNEAPEGDLAAMTPEQVREAVRKFYTDRLDTLSAYERSVPQENATPAAAYVRIARHIADTGDLSEFDTPDNMVAIKADEDFLKRECGIAPPD